MNSQDGYLHIWGKNYAKPTLIKPKVIMASAGENHVLFMTKNKEVYGLGSNRFGQLGIKETQFYEEPIQLFQGLSVISVHCGAQHSFVINDKNQVYSTGLNIKGQLGQGHFQNINTPKIVAALLPSGIKNNKSLSPNISKPSKSPIVQILEKFDLQVKIQDSSQKTFLLENEEYVINIACGALFTVVLTNKNRVLTCGLIGSNSLNNLEEQIEKTKFKQVVFDCKIQHISAGLSGATAISKQGFGFYWGRFGKMTVNFPKKVERQKRGVNNNQDLFIQGSIGDEFAIFLTSKGQILLFGENIDNQLGCETHVCISKPNFEPVEGIPFVRKIYVGRNNVFAIDVETNQLYGWGSNKYGQIIPIDSLKGLLHITNSKLKVLQSERIIPSSYFSLIISKQQNLLFPVESQQAQSKDQQKTIPFSQYKKLYNDYQLIKAINMTLLQKYQPIRKQTKEVQTTSKFQISGVTQHRKFQSNTEILWKQIQIQSQINEGGYGIIYKARWRQIQVVVKKFKIENGDVSLRDFLSQCHAMEAVRHPNIVMFLGAVTTNPNYSIILQYCSKGSLWSYLQNKDNNITWEDRRRFAMEIAQGVFYLHSCTPPILHRDLKSLNIFLDINLRIKIGDFGWTKALEQYMTYKIGTYQWMAPEVIGNKPYTEKADIFSYAIILWQIASRQPPYRNINGAKVSEEVLNRQLRPTIPPKCPQSYAKLMKRCWESDPFKRPNFREIIRELQVMKLA